MTTMLPALHRGRLARLAGVWAAGTAAIGWLALVALLLAFVQGSRAHGDSPISAIVRFVGYFTTLSNLLVATGLTFRALAPGSRAGSFFARPSTSAAMAVYITTVAIVYSAMLRNLWHPVGWLNAIDHLLHHVVPVLYLGYWILMTPKGHLRWPMAITWLAFPLAYLLCVLARGAWSGRYPYPFLDAGMLGPAQVFGNVLLVTSIFLGVGLAIVAVDRRMAPRRPTL
jgi:hypothetical protein